MLVLNPGQQAVLNAAVNWFHNSSEQIFEFDGEAGTGKSVTLNAIIRELNLKPSQYMPMAYTGAAAIVMRTRGLSHAKTIHSSLYHAVEVPVFSDKPMKQVNTEMDIKRYVTRFEPIPPEMLSKDIKLFIIDEGFMVPAAMKKELVKYGRKILVTGDSGQLPPVEGQPAFLIGDNVMHLSEIMRQAANNPILYLAHQARRGLPISCGLYGNDALVITTDELTPEMVVNSGPIICGRNNTRDYFNRVVRQYFGYTDEFPTYGERLICRNNNWEKDVDGISLTNGLSGYCISPFDICRFDRYKYEFDFLADMANIPFYGLKLDVPYFTAPNAEVRRQLKEKINTTKARFYSGELFEYAYAITTHVSQGSEYPCGLIYEEHLGGGASFHAKLLYTAITRFKQKLILVKEAPRYR